MDEIRKRFDQLEHKGISVKACFAEMIGVATFVLLGLLVATFVGHFQSDAGVMLNTAVVALTFGLGIAIVIYMTAHNSGGHVNPAVTVGMMFAGITSPVQAAGNIIGQVLGGIIAATLLHVLVPHSILKGSHLGANVLPDHSNWINAFMAEMIATFICQLVILETVCNKKSKAGNQAPMIIGLTFFLGILAVAPISGASLNPARSLGPAIMSGYFNNLWIYIIAPCCGAALAAPVHLFSITDIDTITHPGEASVEDGPVEPLLPNTAGDTN